MFMPWFSDSLVNRLASGGYPAISPATSIALAISSACGTTHCARPMRPASSAFSGKPMPRRIALPLPPQRRLRRNDAELDLRQPPFGALGGDDHVAAPGDDGADADRIAVDRPDQRLWKIID